MAAIPGTHSTGQESGWFGGCAVVCDFGWSDCDGNPSNGCETPSSLCTKDGGSKDAASTKPELLTTLSGAPRGLAACGDIYYFDDDELHVWNGVGASTVLQSSGMPSGGLACDTSSVYWATLSDSDGGPNGNVWSLSFGHDAAAPLAIAVDPGRGIDVRASHVYWIARSGFGPSSQLAYSIVDLDATAPSAPVIVMPANESEGYKAFALSYDGDYALWQGTVQFFPVAADAGPPHAIDIDASQVTSLFAGAGGAYATLHGALSFDAGGTADASDASDDANAASDASADADDADDADADTVDAEAGPPPVFDSIIGLTGTPSSISTGFARILATTGNGSAIVATDGTLYYVDLPLAIVTEIVSGVLHVSDVAMDATYVYYTTRGQGTTPGALWRAVLP